MQIMARASGDGGIPSNNEQPSNARQRRDDFLDHAKDEVFLLRVFAHVRERQNGDRGVVWKCRAGGARWIECSGSSRGGDQRSIDLVRASDVFEVWVPRSSTIRSSLSPIWSRTVPETQIPPVSASASSRAATFTPSPWMSPSSTITSEIHADPEYDLR